MNSDKIYNLSREEVEKTFDLQELWYKFLRRRKLFFFIAAAVFVGTVIAQVLSPYTPIYRATFDIGVTGERPIEGFFSQYQEGTVTQIGAVTQRVIANLLSVKVAEKVVDSLSLCAHVRNGRFNDIQINVIEKSEFTEILGPFKMHIKDSRIELNRDGKRFASGQVGQYFDIGPVDIRVTTVSQSPEEKIYELALYPKNRVALALRNSLSIEVLEADKIEKEMASSGVPFSGEKSASKLVSATNIFPGMNLVGILRIDVHWGNPGDARRIAEVLSTQIIEENISEKSLQYIQSKTFIDSQLTLYQGNLRELEEEIRIFKESKNIADLRASTQALISQISQIESRKSQLEIEQIMLRDLNEYLAANGSDSSYNFAATMISDPVLQNFYSNLLEVEGELRGLRKEYAAGHPKVIEVKARLDGLQDQMKEEISKRTSTIRTEISSVENQIRVLQAKLENVPEDEIQLARLERDRETAEKLYTFFAEKLEETRVQEAGVTSDLKIVNPPIVSMNPVNSKSTMKNVLIALSLSILFGGLAVIVAEYIDNTIKAPETVFDRIGLPVFASIPIIGTSDDSQDQKNLLEKLGLVTRKRKSHMKHSDTRIKLLDKSVTSAEFEVFRKLSMNLDFSHPEKRYQVVYVTSPGPEEGKTFVAFHLGYVLGTIGKKVIVIDTDFRKKRGHLTDVTHLKKRKGIFNLLKGEIPLDEVIIPFNSQKPEQERSSKEDHNTVDLLPVGDIPPNPFTFLESTRMQEVIEELKKKYEYVIVDGVPVLLFADATYLANFTDGVLITARYGKTGFKELENSKDILQSSRANIIGLVMNGVHKTRGTYYYHYYHRYYSKYYKSDT